MNRSQLVSWLHSNTDNIPEDKNPKIIITDGSDTFVVLSTYASEDEKIIFIDIEKESK